MPRYGTSEDFIITSTGPLRLLADTAEVCTTCENSAAGPTCFGIIRETPTSATLICPNCGDQKTVPVNEVKRVLLPGQLSDADHQAKLIAEAKARGAAQAAAVIQARAAEVASLPPTKADRPAKAPKAQKAVKKPKAAVKKPAKAKTKAKKSAKARA